MSGTHIIILGYTLCYKVTDKHISKKYTYNLQFDCLSI